MPAEDEAESTTRATVSEGEIEIRDKENQKQDLAGLNRDTQIALNKLGEIFDKDSIEERQELAGLFGELAYNQIHFMEGTDEQKAVYHALVGGIMAELTNGDFLAGASAAAVNKMVSDKIIDAAKGDPAVAQWLSAGVGALASEIIGYNNWLGASIAIDATKFNKLAEQPQKIAVIVYPGVIGHVSLLIDDKEVNYGRYVINPPSNTDEAIRGTSANSGASSAAVGVAGGGGASVVVGGSSLVGSITQAPIGEGAVLIYNDYVNNRKAYKPGVVEYELELTPSEAAAISKEINNLLENQATIWNEKLKEQNTDRNNPLLDGAYRFNETSTYKEYVLWQQNCTTFTMDILKKVLGENDKRIKLIANSFIPADVSHRIKENYK